MRKSQVRKIDSVIKEFLGEINIDKKLREVSPRMVRGMERVRETMI